MAPIKDDGNGAVIIKKRWFKAAGWIVLILIPSMFGGGWFLKGAKAAVDNINRPAVNSVQIDNMRTEIINLTTRVNNFEDVFDTKMDELSDHVLVIRVALENSDLGLSFPKDDR